MKSGMITILAFIIKVKIGEFDPSRRNKSQIYSASCHTNSDIDISNRKTLTLY